MSKFPLTVRQIAKIVGGTVQGDDSAVIESISSLDQAGPGDVTFASEPKHARKLATCQAGAAIVSDQVADAPMPLIKTAHVPEAVARLLGELAETDDAPPVGIDPTARIHEKAEISPDAAIGPFVTVGAGSTVGPKTVLRTHVSVGNNVTIGNGCDLHENVVVKSACSIGDRAVIGSNSVIGFDGFGYYFKDGRHNKVPHIGAVVIEDDVEIGACSCIDRAKFGMTRIGAGTKIDNLVQVAHNVETGKACILIAQVGIAGSSKLGNGVILAGHCGVRDNVSLGDGVVAGAFSAIAGDIEAGVSVLGIPAGPVREKLRAIKATDKLPETMKRLSSLEKRLSDLESANDH